MQFFHYSSNTLNRCIIVYVEQKFLLKHLWLLSQGGISREMIYIYIYIYIHIQYIQYIYSSPSDLATAQSHCLMMIGRDGGLRALYHNYWFACQQKVLKMFPGTGYLRSAPRMGQCGYISILLKNKNTQFCFMILH